MPLQDARASHHPSYRKVAERVMIGQNRQAAYQQAKADHDFDVSEQELHANTAITQAIHDLTREIHEHVVGVAEVHDIGKP